MRRLRRPSALAFASALIAFLTGASASFADPDFEDPAGRARTTRLPNGLTVLTLEDHATPVVAFQMWVKAGSRDESLKDS